MKNTVTIDGPIANLWDNAILVPVTYGHQEVDWHRIFVAENVLKHFKRGDKVRVEASLHTTIKDGKPSLHLVAEHISLLPKKPASVKSEPKSRVYRQPVKRNKLAFYGQTAAIYVVASLIAIYRLIRKR